MLQWMVMAGLAGQVAVRAVVRRRRWWLQEPPDVAGEVAFEAAHRFASALALRLLAREVGGGNGVQAAFGDREAMQRAVELAIATAVKAVAGEVPGLASKDWMLVALPTTARCLALVSPPRRV